VFTCSSGASRGIGSINLDLAECAHSGVGVISRRLRLASEALVVAILVTLIHPAPAAADLGNCDGALTYQFVGGEEDQVPADTRGVQARVYLKNPDLCNGPANGADSTSTSWVMLAHDVAQEYYQIGTIRPFDASCLVAVMQYNPHTGPTVTSLGTKCFATATWYRYVIVKKIGSATWESYILWDSDGTFRYNTPNDPNTLDFTVGVGQFAAETHDPHDQIGGNNASRLTFDLMRWRSADYAGHSVDFSIIEQFCDLCGFAGPYNVNHVDADTQEIWTDGF
jgi:hypothetical protein